MVDLFIIAGEASGDQLGEGLLQALKPYNLKVMGLGGPKMRAVGMETVFPMENLQVMGFVDVFFSLPHLIRCFNKTVDAILKAEPKVVVTIDYPGFNLRLARTLKKKGFKGKICHYVCPSVWAWGKKRIPLMAENLDLLLSILPFEKQLFEKTKLPVEYIGHPLVQKIAPQGTPEGHLIAFFPSNTDRTSWRQRQEPFARASGEDRALRRRCGGGPSALPRTVLPRTVLPRTVLPRKVLPRSRGHRVVPRGNSLGKPFDAEPFDAEPFAPANRRGEFLIQRGRRPIVSHMFLLYPFPINGSPWKIDTHEDRRI